MVFWTRFDQSFVWKFSFCFGMKIIKASHTHTHTFKSKLCWNSLKAVLSQDGILPVEFQNNLLNFRNLTKFRLSWIVEILIDCVSITSFFFHVVYATLYTMDKIIANRKMLNWEIHIMFTIIGWFQKL